MSTAEQEPVHRDPEWLRRKHYDEGLTQAEMAELTDVSRSTIHRRMKEHGIETIGRRATDERLADPEWLRRKHHDEGLSQAEIGELVGVSQQAVHRHLKNHGVDTRSCGWSNKMHSDEKLLDDLRCVADDLGRTPDTRDYKKHGKHSHTTLIERFGTWRDALRATGVL